MEYEAMLGEGMLPIHRMKLEESRVRVSEKSLCSAFADVILNRLDNRKLPKRTKWASRSSRGAGKDSSELDSLAFNNLDTPRMRRRLLGRDYCEVSISGTTLALRTPNMTSSS